MVKVKQAEAKQILIDFGIMDEADFLSARLDRFKRQTFDDDVIIYQFDYQKQHFAFVIDNFALGDKAIITENLDWADRAEVLANPKSPATFGYPFEQKTLYLIRQQADKIRLDQLATEQFSDFSRSRLQKMIKKGLIKVDGEVIKATNKLVDLEAKLELDYQAPTKQPLQLEIIYEDDDILAINKPAGVLTHAKNKDDLEYTVSDFVKDHLGVKSDDLRYGIVHRLDRLTSGVLVCAKNPAAFDYLKQQFKDRKVQKTYLAITSGDLKNDKALIDLPIARSTKQPSRFQVDANGKDAQTNYQLIESKNGYNLLQLQPKTGRTHQLRVHLAYLNNPIVGDSLYQGQVAPRLMLHAKTLVFKNLAGQTITVESDVPQEFEQWMNS